MFKSILANECPECKEIIKDGDTCCPPEIFEAWQCEVCHEIYEDKPDECEACQQA